ncbi:hypothetical protein PHET_03702 [Paragonimus heterotremus]|uniref:LNS2/PITP domain-containing protein n=1 Tax=Paragonimus heterotremus TaxID=100268 RepID=A0A8J4SR01_9TREM|nr:hypothetical protein PHET_03702 [Paragonimus heterotremus]
MDVIGSLLSGAKSYYNSLNEANSTGAIDVIVVNQPDGTLKSTPFHVRFGKAGILWPRAHTVEVLVNGQLISDVRMRIGPNGHAYFEPLFQTEFNRLAVSNQQRLSFQDSCLRSCQEPHNEVHSIDQTDTCGTSTTGDTNIRLQQTESAASTTTIKSDMKINKSRHLLGKGKESQNLVSNNNHVNSFKELVHSLFEPTNRPEGFRIFWCSTKWPRNPEDVEEYKMFCATILSCCSPYQGRKDCDSSGSQRNHRQEGEIESDQSNAVQVDVFDKVTESQPPVIKELDFEELDNLPEEDSSHLIVSWSGEWMPWNHAVELLRKQLTQSIQPSPETVDNHGDTETELERLPMQLNEVMKPPYGIDCEQDETTDPMCQSDVVQPLRAPIRLPIWSPEPVPSDDESVDYSSSESKDDSSHNLKSVDPGEDRSSADTGYLSEEEHGTPNQPGIGRRKSSFIHRRLSSQATCFLTSDQLKKLNLCQGVNEAVFSVITKYQGTCQCACYVYLWDWTDKIVISDIDGTITRSDLLGQLMPLVGLQWIQPKVVQLYDRIANNGYRFVYLSSRAIGQARATRRFLHSVIQDNAWLPDGPILLAPFSALHAFRKEVIERRAEEFKIDCLRQIEALFSKDHNSSENVPALVAGFGNRLSDIISYRAVGIKDHQIFIVNNLGNIMSGTSDPVDQRNHLANKASCSVGGNLSMTYDSLLSMVDLYFPPITDRLIHAAEYSDFAFWRA